MIRILTEQDTVYYFESSPSYAISQNYYRQLLINIFHFISLLAITDRRYTIYIRTIKNARSQSVLVYSILHILTTFAMYHNKYTTQKFEELHHEFKKYHSCIF